MIFVLAAVFILVISFVVALISLVREQSKIEKAATDVSSGADQINIQEPQAVEKKAPEPELANLNVSQSQSQTPTQTQGENLNGVNLAQKPWWEKEIQKRDEQPQGSTYDWQNAGQVQRPDADVIKTEGLGEVAESEDRVDEQAQKEKNHNLRGSFSLSDLKGADQES